MRIASLVLLTYVSISSIAQANKWSISYENSVSRINLDHVEYAEDTRGYSALPRYFQGFDDNLVTRVRSYSGDTILGEISRTFYRPLTTVYFRNTYLGIGRNIRTSEFLDISHSAGLTFSLADYSLGTIRSYLDTDLLGFDSVDMSSSEARSGQSISAYKKVRRVALSYENVITLKSTKWLHLSMGARHNLHFKFIDQFLTTYSEYVDTVELFNDFFFGVDDESRNLVSINLYDRQYPSEAAEESSRDASLQYDLTLFIRPEVLLGRAKRTSIYLNVGLTPFHFYGWDFVPREHPIWYGLGMSKRW